MKREEFASKLRQARRESELNQIDAAVALDIPRSTLANYETGRTEPDIDTLGKLINFYNIDANWLLSTNTPDEDDLRELERLLDLIKEYVELDSKANKEEILKRFCILLYEIS